MHPCKRLSCDLDTWGRSVQSFGAHLCMVMYGKIPALCTNSVLVPGAWICGAGRLMQIS